MVDTSNREKRDEHGARSVLRAETRQPRVDGTRVEKFLFSLTMNEFVWVLFFAIAGALLFIIFFFGWIVSKIVGL